MVFYDRSQMQINEIPNWINSNQNNIRISQYMIYIVKISSFKSINL